MNGNRILVCIVLGAAASVGGSTDAKVVTLRVAAKTSVSDTCLYALSTELNHAGITTQDATEGADAEMVAAFDFVPEQPWPTGDQESTTYSIVVKSFPEQHLLYADQGNTRGNNAAKACAKLAKTAVKKFLAAGGLK